MAEDWKEALAAGEVWKGWAAAEDWKEAPAEGGEDLKEAPAAAAGTSEAKGRRDGSGSEGKAMRW